LHLLFILSCTYLKIFVTRKKQQPLVEINEHSLSWFWHGMTTKKIVLFKEILWAKKERDNIYFFSQSSFSECFPLHELHPINAEKIEALIVKELHENKVQYLVK
jgi:hypothetical protein